MCFLFRGSIDWSKVWDGYQLWYAVFGALVGSFIAIYITKRIDKHKRQGRKIAAKKALIEGLAFNNTRVGGMLSFFASGGESNFLLDTTGIVIWLTLSEDIIGEELLKDVNWHRYQLDHVNAKLLVYYVATLATAHDDRLDDKARARESICQHLKKVSEDVGALIGRLERE